MFALNMDMLWFAAIEAEKNSLYGPEISRIVGMPFLSKPLVWILLR